MGLGRSLQGNKQGKRFKLATRNVGSGGDTTSTSRTKGDRRNKKVESGGNRFAIGVSYANESKGTKRGVFGKRDGKIWNNAERDESQAEGNRGFKSSNFDWKRKRNGPSLITHGGRITVHNAGRPSRKFLTKHRDDIVEEKKTKTRRLQTKFEQSSRNASLAERRNPGQSEFLEKKNSGAKSKAMHKVKDVEVEVERHRTDKLKKSAKSKSKASKQSEQEQRKAVTFSSERTSKKKGQDKQSTIDDSQEKKERPKKKKRRIRIDPYDTSNKRLDDEMTINCSIQKKEEDTKSSDAELSQNAQFRAIIPSLSILSFVEDNLLGRRREIEFRRAGYNIELSAPLDSIPHSSSSERERIEETVFRNKLTFFAAAKISTSFPPSELPEIAFAGRSNVGKSSILNALTRQWGVVRTSDKPGLTQTINFFKLASKLCLVDLPGYGFAYAKEDVKEAWEELVKEYVSTRVGLKRVCLLVDTKWGMKPRDLELVDLMERSQTKYQIVLTKTDIVFPIDVARRAMQIEESLKEKKSVVQPVMMVSSKTGAGIRSLRTVLSKIARFVKP